MNFGPSMPDNLPAGRTAHLDVAKEYISASYDPKRTNADAVKHLWAPGNRFIAPTTFPNVHTLEEYVEDHGKCLFSVVDISQFREISE